MANLAPLTDDMILAVVKSGKPKKLGHNTHLVKTDSGYGIRYHHTVVVDFISPELVQLWTGGWSTVTTKQRISEYIPGYVSQRNFEWFLTFGGKEIPFNDGMILDTFTRNWPVDMCLILPNSFGPD